MIFFPEISSHLIIVMDKTFHWIYWGCRFAMGFNVKAVVQRDMDIFKLVIKMKGFFCLELKLNMKEIKGRWL